MAIKEFLEPWPRGRADKANPDRKSGQDYQRDRHDAGAFVRFGGKLDLGMFAHRNARMFYGSLLGGGGSAQGKAAVSKKYPANLAGHIKRRQKRADEAE